MSGINLAITIVALLLILVILLQQRSAGLGGAFGGDSSVFTSRRGAEKTLYRLTILLSLVFVGLALYQLYLNRPAPVTATQTPVSTETTPLPTNP